MATNRWITSGNFCSTWLRDSNVKSRSNFERTCWYPNNICWWRVSNGTNIGLIRGRSGNYKSELSFSYKCGNERCSRNKRNEILWQKWKPFDSNTVRSVHRCNMDRNIKYTRINIDCWIWMLPSWRPHNSIEIFAGKRRWKENLRLDDFPLVWNISNEGRIQQNLCTSWWENRNA